MKRLLVEVLIIVFLSAGLLACQSVPAPVQDNSERLLRKQAIDHLENRQWDEAIVELTEILEIAPRDKWVYMGLGVAFYGKEDYSQAIANYTKALEIDPGMDSSYLQNAYLERGIAFYDKEQYDQAIADFTKALELGPSNAIAYSLRGGAHLAKLEFDQARNDVTQAQKLGAKIPPDVIELLEMTKPGR